MSIMTVIDPSLDPARFDVRGIPCKQKHPMIFHRWNNLPVGGYFILVNDHDPVPLYYQFAALFPGAFTWEHVGVGPEEFAVKITRLVTTASKESASSSGGCGGHHHERKPAVQSAEGQAELQPIANLFAELEKLPPGGFLRALTGHKPVEMLSALDARGFDYESTEQKDGSWINVIKRR